MTAEPRDVWLDTADRIAARVIGSAQWDGKRCTWSIRVSDRKPGVLTAHSEPAPGTLYQGTVGIALFLIELYRFTNAADVLATAEGAVQHALSAPMAAARFGFHSGTVGLAYACYRMGVVASRADYLLKAEELLAPLVGLESEDHGLDVIGGAAGAIPPLLQMSDHLPSRLTIAVADALGEHILDSANRRPFGWSWRGPASAVRDLAGYAHGAAGYGHALVELFNTTGDTWFRYGAEQAFAYERRFFAPGLAGWPDFRYTDVSEYLSYGRLRELRDRLSTGDGFPPYTPSFPIMWCHGAPGIGLARLRAYEVLDDLRYREEAVIAASTTAASVRGAYSNYSLCHGYFGNCETLLYAARILGLPELRREAENRALIGRESFEMQGRDWPCGTLGSVTDPSLMLGEAGIGYFYLRLYDDTTPCLLCLTPPAPVPTMSRVSRDVAELRLNCVNQYFGVTRHALDRLQPGAWVTSGPCSASPDIGDVDAVHSEITAIIAAQPAGEPRELLVDAFAVENVAFTMAHATTQELARELLSDATRHGADDVQWNGAVFKRDERVRIVRTRRNWTQELEDAPLAEISDEGMATAVWRVNGTVRIQQLSVFASLVLDSVVEVGNMATIIRRVAARVEGSSVDQLAPAVAAQIQSAYNAGLVRCIDSVLVSPRPERHDP